MYFPQLRDFSSLYRQCFPSLVGFCVGITFCLILSLSMEKECQDINYRHIIDAVNIQTNKAKLEEIKNPLENEDEDLSGYEPRINLAGKPHLAKKEPQTLIRPRYFSTELGMKDKSFVAVLSSIKNIPSMGIVINETLSNHVNRIAFFVEVGTNEKLDVKTLPIVGFRDSQQGLLTLHTLKYLSDKLANSYSFFFLAKDTTYINGKKLVNLLNHISVNENVYMGAIASDFTSNPTVCSLDAGILISSPVLLAIAPLLESCTEEFAFNSDDEKVGLCIHKVLNMSCQTHLQGQAFKTFNLNAHINDVRQLEKTWDSQMDLQSALTSFHAKDPTYFYMLDKLSCSTALKDIHKNIQGLEQSILQQAPKTPGGLKSVSWPLGYQPPSKPETRFGVIRWEYFNETHVFFDREQSVTRHLTGIYLEDIQDVINATVVNELKENPNLKYVRLSNGYKKFDPTRGMDYILELVFRTTTGTIVSHRYEACRPLTHIDTVPMPYVTESSMVHIILVLWEEHHVKAAEKFVHSFAMNMMAKSDKSELTLILFTSSERKEENNPFKSLEALAESFSNQFKKQGSKINAFSYKLRTRLAPHLFEFTAIDLLSNQIGPDSLVFLCSPYSEFFPDLLNRVRINTISGWQLYSPIPFSEYNPNISFSGMKKTGVLEVSTNQGFYDVHDTLHISFYIADYLNARKTFELEMGLVKSDKDIEDHRLPYESILSMFTRLRQLHILRAVEPHLRVHYHFKKCLTYQCHESLLLSQGTRSQLAQLVLERETPLAN